MKGNGRVVSGGGNVSPCGCMPTDDGGRIGGPCGKMVVCGWVGVVVNIGSCVLNGGLYAVLPLLDGICGFSVLTCGVNCVVVDD